MGAALDPQAEAFLHRLRALGAPGFGEQPVAEARRAMEEGAAALFGPVDPVPWEDGALPGPAGPIPVRRYAPPEAGPGTLVYFHGGGFVLGSLDSHHGLCARLASRSGCRVLAVDYRLAPEHPFPAAVEDAWAAVEWACRGGPSGRPQTVAVGGDSAGGNLAAVCALRARDRGVPLALQLLIYPVLDASLDTPSYRTFAEGYYLTREGMRWFWDQYLPQGDRLQPEASPLRARDLGGVAPARVITAGCDVLRDEAEAYAGRLRAAGVEVALSRYEGLIHGFLRMPAVLDRAREALEEAAAAVRRALAG